MKPTVRIARVWGVPVGAHWSTLFVLALFATELAILELPTTSPGYAPAEYWVVAIGLAVVFLASILAHELAHAAVAHRHGVVVDSITLWLLGGVAQLRSHAPDPDAELGIALAGPAASLAIGVGSGVTAVALYEVGAPGLLVGAFAWLAMVSTVLAVFNLLPGAPLDGGRVVAALLWRRTGDERGSRRRAARIGQTLGQVMIALGIFEVFVGAGGAALWFVLLGWFIMSAARREEADLDVRGVLSGVCVGDVMTTRPSVAHRGTSIAEFVEEHARCQHGSSFPVVDDAGRLAGLVTFRRVRAVPPDAWTTTTVDQVALGPLELWTASPQEELLEVLARGGGGDGRIVVVEQGHVVGIVAPSDVTQAMARLGLQADLRTTGPASSAGRSAP